MDSSKTASLINDQSNFARLLLKERFLCWMLRNVRSGRLHITFPSGAQRVVGEAGEGDARLVIKDAAFLGKVVRGGSVGFGESYVAGDWESPDLSALLLLMARNQKDLGKVAHGFSVLTRQMNRLYHKARRNTLAQSRDNIQAHYDLSNEFYKTFLDPTMTYSSGLFKEPEESLEQAQYNKIDRMLDLAGVQPGHHILEIGSGWGALALRAAQRGCRVKTITLSEAQFAYAKDLFEQAGVADRVEIVLEDYRAQSGTYDAVLSCEMIEAVGREYLDSYFEIVGRSLKKGARAVIQAITISDDRYERYSESCDWIQKHIFPGGHLPSPGAIRQHVGAAENGQVVGMHSFRSDYAETLRRWASAFNAAQARVAELGFDETFRRKWNYYLSYCEAGFDAGLIDVQHLVIEN